MSDLIAVSQIEFWERLKALVLDSVSPPITRRIYNMAMDEFLEWFRRQPQAHFNKASVNAWRASLERRTLGLRDSLIFGWQLQLVSQLTRDTP